MSPRALVGVLGGMGPLATVDFLAKLVAESSAVRDQDHVAAVVWNVPQIPDRQDALAGRGPSPVPAMAEGLARLADAGAGLIVIACNTAHIWFDELAAASPAPLLHIADAAAAVLRASVAPGARIGLVATRGLTEAGLYQKRLLAAGYCVATSTEDELDGLFTPGCYAVKRGAMDEGARRLGEVGERLLARGADHLLLACTEVPAAYQHVSSPLLARSTDATAALARACVSWWSERTNLRRDPAETIAETSRDRVARAGAASPVGRPP